MDVLYVNHTATISGGERSLLILLGGLPASVGALVATPDGALAEAVRGLGLHTSPITGTAGSLRLHPLHTPIALAQLMIAAAQVRRTARRMGADVVHANSIRAGIALGLGRLAPTPTVVHVRDCLPAGAASTATLRLIAATATTVVANSAYTARSVRSAAPRARLEVVHNPVDLTRFDPGRIDRLTARARLAGELGEAVRGRLLLGVVAQISPWKGQDTAVEALRLLVREGVDAHLLLIGSAKFVASSTRFDNEGFVERLRQRIASSGLQERVSWLGEREDVPELVRALDVLMLPSHEEPFGRALIEAMALEVPVLATDVGGPSEIIVDGREGYLLPPRQPEAWARAAAAIGADAELAAALGAAGRRRVEEAFTVSRHVRSMLDVYERARAASAERA